MKYYAFISYKHVHKANAPWAKADHLWAAAINKYLINWKIPKELDRAKLINETDKRIAPVFRDENEIYGGDETAKILQDNLLDSKSLIVICSEKMNMDQQEKQKNENDRAYIYEEIDFFIRECPNRPIILVWIDEKPFDKNSPYCLPPQLKHRDIKVIEANTYRKSRFSIKRRTTAEIAASIFQTNKGLFWDFYKKRRQKTFQIIALTITVVLLFFGTILWSLNRDNNINKAYINIAEANELLTQGKRFEAMQHAKTAYETYPSAEGLTTLMRKCLDKSIPYTVCDSPIELSEDGSIYTTITDEQFVNIYDAHTNQLLNTIDATHVENVDISKDNNLIGCVSSKDSTRVFDRRVNGFTVSIRNFGDGYENDKIRLSRSGTWILTHKEIHINTLMYNSKEPNTPYYMPLMTYSTIDTVAWRTVECSFMGSDSLFVSYGREAVWNERELSKDKSKDRWACYIYNLNQRDSLRKDRPELLNKIEVPENTTNIAVSEAGKIIIATTDNIIIHNYTDNRYYVTTRNYSSIITGYTLRYDLLYKDLYPDWDKIQIVDILFSLNHKYALLITSENIRYTINLNNYPSVSTSNGIRIDKDPRLYGKSIFNKKDVAIGITNDGDIIIHESNISVGNNILINGKHVQNYFFKPKQDGDSKYIAHINENQLFISEKNKHISYNSDRETTSHYKSYIYRKTVDNK